eukprot:CAMPEP_0170549624 /NCGR_PEP_ID=MMETSP0211-20121228/7772_1 /TAXON_ID=311385 /ORGANISM="Pseudokeronopsis sp., Strain OXSARD2" /LENGTH=54 /DNA_ID=CAMNT_0010855747 /DNA_START=637 /DNA_END=801 /DNA_ORIENTATION=-
MSEEEKKRLEERGLEEERKRKEQQAKEPSFLLYCDFTGDEKLASSEHWGMLVEE